MEWLITNAIAALLVPPGSLLALAAAGGLLARRRPRLGRSIVGFALLALYVLATPIASQALLAALEPPARDPLADRRAQAIVVLGGGTYFSAPEYGRDTVGGATLSRLRYAAHLQRASGLPVLLTGGAPLGNATSEAEQMRRVLELEFRVPARWLETVSRNTLENARLSHAILAPQGIRRIYLVTHAWHMARAQLAFERAGFEVIPAATGYATRYRVTVLSFLPGALALLDSSWFFHEAIGIGWYHLRLARGQES